MVAALALLFVAAENRDRVFSDETGLSGSIAVALAAAYFFAAQDWPAGAFVACAAGGLYVPHLRRLDMAKIAVNASCFGVSAAAASLLINQLEHLGIGSPAVWLSVLGATFLYWALNSLLLGLVFAALNRGSIRREVIELMRSDTLMLVFGLGGGLCGVAMVEDRLWVGVATLVALLVALDVFVISFPGGALDLRARWVMLATRGISGGVAGTVGALVTRAVSVSVLGAFAGIAAGVAAGVAVVAIIVLARLFVRYGSADAATVRGLLLVESVVPIVAASTAVVAVVAGLDVGLLYASIVVIAFSVIVAVHRHRSAKRTRVEDDDVLLGAVVEAITDGLPVRDR